jgi:hypothetical protein
MLPAAALMVAQGLPATSEVLTFYSRPLGAFEAADEPVANGCCPMLVTPPLCLGTSGLIPRKAD